MIEDKLKELKKEKTNLETKTKRRDAMYKKYAKHESKGTAESMTQEKDRAENEYFAALKKFEAGKQAVFAAVEKKVAKIEKKVVKVEEKVKNQVEKVEMKVEEKVKNQVEKVEKLKKKVAKKAAKIAKKK